MFELSEAGDVPSDNRRNLYVSDYCKRAFGKGILPALGPGPFPIMLTL